MPLTPVQSQQGTVNGTALTAVFDDAPAEGNLLVAAVNSSSFGSMTSSGWTPGPAADDFSALYLFYKIAAAAESDTVTFTLNGSDRAAMWIGEFSGNAPSGVLDQVATNETGNSSATVASGTTAATTDADELAIAVFAAVRQASAGASTFTAYSGGFAEAGQVGIVGGDHPLVAVATRALAATGAQSCDATLSTAENHPMGLIATFVAAELPTIGVSPGSLDFSYGGPYFDLQVFDVQELVDAIEDPEIEGKTIMVRAGDYGPLTLTARYSAMTTIRAWPGDPITLGPVTLDVSYLRVQGFDMPDGGFDTNQTGCHHLEILENYIHDAPATALALWGALEGLIDHDIVFERNHVARLTHLGEFYQGYGVVSRVNFDQVLTSVRIAYNTFEDLQADAMVAALDGFEVIGNDIKRVLPPPDPIPDPHPDGIMLWAGTKNGVVKDNRVVDCADTLMGGSTVSVLVENNLIVQTRGRGVDGGATGTSDAAVESYTFRRNTVYSCFHAFAAVGGFGGLGCVSLTGNTTEAGATNVLDENIFGSLDVWELEQFDTARFGPNVIERGYLPGPQDMSRRPRFANLTDWLPLGLPAGYENLGYRRAACGHRMD